MSKLNIIEEFEKDFESLWEVTTDNNGEKEPFEFERLKDFIRTALKESFEAGQDSMREEVENLITKEILICHHENTPTSRLTSLAVKFSNISKLQTKEEKE